jgi:hypothetical protein
MAEACVDPGLRRDDGKNRYSSDGLEAAGHDEGVDEAEARVPEGGGKAADDLKAEALPQVHGALVGADHEVELHGQEATPARLLQRMLGHLAGDASAALRRVGRIGGIGDVVAAT